MSKPAEIDSDHMETYLGYSIPSFHNRTDCKNTLVYCNGYVELHQRYEGWVDLLLIIGKTWQPWPIF